MVEVTFEDEFRKKFCKIKDKLLKDKIIKQITKIKLNPEFGKPMRFARSGTRELYIAPYRLSYSFVGGHVRILNIYHKDKQ